jgi:hypothetical protein
MRIQSSHDHAARGLDAYFSPPEAVSSLLGIERVLRRHRPAYIDRVMQAMEWVDGTGVQAVRG